MLEERNEVEQYFRGAYCVVQKVSRMSENGLLLLKFVNTKVDFHRKINFSRTTNCQSVDKVIVVMFNHILPTFGQNTFLVKVFRLRVKETMEAVDVFF